MDTKMSHRGADSVPIHRPRPGEKKTLYPLLLILVSFGVLGCAHGRLVSPAGQIETVPRRWDPVWEEVSEGVGYVKVEEEGLQPAVRLVRIELTNPHLQIEVPPPFPGGMEPEKLGAYGLSGSNRIIALWNGTPFRYRKDENVQDLEKSRIMEPTGVWISGGVLYSSQENEYGILQRNPSGGVEITIGKEAYPEAEWAVGGYLPILRGGRNIGIHGERHARTAVGVSRDGGTLYVCVVEGHSLFLPGLTSRETAEVLLAAGAWDALNLDGGNSSFLLINRNSEDSEDHEGTEEADKNEETGERIFYRGSRERVPCFMLIVSTN